MTISDPNDWEDHRRIYDTAFAEYQFVALPEKSWSDIAVNSGEMLSLPLACGAPGLVLPREANVEIRTELPRFVFAPVAADNVIGRVTVLADGEKVLCAPVYCTAGTGLDSGVPLTVKEKFQRSWDMYCRYGIYRSYPMYY